MKKKLLKKVLLVAFLIGLAIFLYYQFGWKTYTDTIDGYKLSVPISYFSTSYDSELRKYTNISALWSIGNPSISGGQCNHDTSERIWINFETMEQYKNAMTFWHGQYLGRPADKSVTVGGIETSWYTYPTGITVGPIVHGQKAYFFSYIAPCEQPKNYTFPQHLDQFNKMLSSFQFTN